MEWSSDKDGSLGTSTPASDGSVAFPFSSLTVETHVITMTVTDELGADCTATLNYTVGAAPTISITSPTDGVTLTTDEAELIEAIVEDMEDAPEALTLSWESGIVGGLLGPAPHPCDDLGPVTVLQHRRHWPLQGSLEPGIGLGAAVGDDQIIGREHRVAISPRMGGEDVDHREEVPHREDEQRPRVDDPQAQG